MITKAGENYCKYSSGGLNVWALLKSIIFEAAFEVLQNVSPILGQSETELSSSVSIQIHKSQ